MSELETSAVLLYMWWIGIVGGGFRLLSLLWYLGLICHTHLIKISCNVKVFEHSQTLQTNQLQVTAWLSKDAPKVVMIQEVHKKDTITLLSKTQDITSHLRYDGFSKSTGIPFLQCQS